MGSISSPTPFWFRFNRIDALKMIKTLSAAEDVSSLNPFGMIRSFFFKKPW
jgi:hypothetical protein